MATVQSWNGEEWRAAALRSCVWAGLLIGMAQLASSQPTNLDLGPTTLNSYSPLIYEATNQITANNGFTIGGSAGVIFHAGNSIILGPGFQAGPGSAATAFHAYIGPVADYTISGTVTSGGIGVSGVTITWSGSQSGSTVTGANGAYSFNVAPGGNYTVTPSMANQTFTPASVPFNNVNSNQVAYFTENSNAQTVTTIDGLISCAQVANSVCNVANGDYWVNMPILVASGVSISGDPNNRPRLLRGPNLVGSGGTSQSIIQIGKDANGQATFSSVTGVNVQNLIFCGGAINQNLYSLSHPEGDPCPQTTSELTCESAGNCAPELYIAHTGPGQPWSSGPGDPTQRTGPYSNQGPYTVTITNCQFEDSPSSHPVFIATVNPSQRINDVLLTNNTIHAGPGSGIQMGAYGGTVNFADYTQCDNWPSPPGFADDAQNPFPRNIRIDTSHFYGNAVSGMGRYVQVVNNNPGISDIPWPSLAGYSTTWGSNAPKGGGGLIEQETCADQLYIANNTISGVGTFGIAGTELYGRNITITGNTVSGFGGEGIGLHSVYKASVTTNHLYNNDQSNDGDVDIKIETSYPGANDCSPSGGACEAKRDTQDVSVQNNDRSGGSAGNVPYGVYFNGDYLDGSTYRTVYRYGTDRISGNNLGAPVSLGVNQRNVISDGTTDYPVGVNGQINSTLLPYLADYPPALVAANSSNPATIAIFPEGNQPLGEPLGANDPGENYRRFFRFGANDPGGSSNLTCARDQNGYCTFYATIQGIFDPSTNSRSTGQQGPYQTAAACNFIYFPASNTIYLDSPLANSTWTGGSSPIGSQGRDLVQPLGPPNPVCTIHAGNSSVSMSANNVMLTLDIELVQTGTWYMYEYAINNGNFKSQAQLNQAPSPWSLWGYWQVNTLP